MTDHLPTPAPSFWSGKRVLLTGHTGFKGAWLALWLNRLGASVTGVSLPPATNPNLASLASVGSLIEHHIADIRDIEALKRLVRSASVDIVLHLAAQALVRTSYREPLDTFSTNIQGTANVLEAVRGAGTARVVVAVTTDKVYRNIEQWYPYRETDPLGGHDPYSASKAAAEIVIASYRDAYLAAEGIAVASARAGNVIGGGDWSLDRLIPDAVRAWGSNGPLTIRRPQALRPWQHVLEPLAAYLVLAERLWADPRLAGAYNFGPPTHEAASVRDIVLLARRSYGSGEIVWGDGIEGPHEAGWLALEVTKARHELGIGARWSLEEGVRRTMEWYRRQQGGSPVRDLCMQDIADFEAAAGQGRSA
ncbi:CDP-glucose 4,6-dehydratase [Bradyrhizobium sp. CCGUVB14]|uniref:CDP-glucose 4,6-dehydratase n=1 Tax=Bradyrhizobium sp. CCGUVB14 TaxID=2949628 RepID=UPI0020B362B4|nr:CDP-glucose 4,6-dehydratase [Bradyrhizobium sp. CCGUVB14]MCP3445676.1 CDP-glucose 4,6-dehydratase [Bradyrhizobium sp. CCGUVB14]